MSGMLSSQIFQDLNCTTKTFDEGAVIFREGEIPSGFLWIQEGNACLFKSIHKVSRTALDTHILSIVGPGNFLGYKAFLLGQNHQISARALRKTKGYWISAEIWKQANGTKLNVEHAITKQCIRQLISLQQSKTESYMSSVGKRVAQVLLLLHRDFGTPIEGGGNVEIQVNLSRKEMAQLASTIDETFVRHITDLKQKGILSARGRKIVICKLEELRSFASN